MATILKSGASPIRDQVSAEEWALRVDLAACYRLMAHYGMTDMVYNHITARVPGGEDHVLINAYGLHYEEITASSLYKIDLEGNVVLQPDTPYGINRAGYVIHSAVHTARADAGCVIHTHTRASMAVSAMRCGLLPLTQTSTRFHNRVAYHDFEGPALDLDERTRLVADLGTHRTMILRNHGTLVLAPSVAQAFNLAYFLEMACKAQVDAMVAGAELVVLSDELAEKSARLLEAGEPLGEAEWPAMRRLLDRRDPGYAE